MKSPRSQAGFTLIELMVVVAVIAILAAVAIPSFLGESRKSKARSEVNAMFAELATKQEQYKVEHSSYLTAAACPAAPAAPSASQATLTTASTACVATGQPWNTLRVALPTTSIYCSYQITTGTAAQVPSPPAPFTMPVQSRGWYFIVATCDMDGKTGNSKYFTSSYDSKTQATAEGT